jgi:hypothetical protein
MLSTITILAAFAIAAVVAQPSPAECNVDPVSGTESCCLPGLPGASLCANVTWVPTQQAIKTSISIGALQLLVYQFDANNTKACAGNPAQASVCAQINNFTVTAQGCCGCHYVDATIASIFNQAPRHRVQQLLDVQLVRPEPAVRLLRHPERPAWAVLAGHTEGPDERQLRGAQLVGLPSEPVLKLKAEDVLHSALRLKSAKNEAVCVPSVSTMTSARNASTRKQTANISRNDQHCVQSSYEKP